MTDEKPIRALVREAQAKDHAAFQDLVARYRDRLEHQIKARMGQSLKAKTGVEVEDLLQETLMRAFGSIEKFRWQGEESFYRWLGSIAEHLIRNAAQKKTWSRLEAKDVTATQESPSKALRREERFDRLEKALGGLNADQRKAITLSRLEGLKVKEIAARMNRSEDAVHKLLARAVLNLRRSFGDTESLALPDRKFQSGEGSDEE